MNDTTDTTPLLAELTALRQRVTALEALAKELRRICPDVPIILCTGYSHVINAKKAQALGIDAFYLKPFGARDLGLVIRRVLQLRSTSTETHTEPFACQALPA